MKYKTLLAAGLIGLSSLAMAATTTPSQTVNSSAPAQVQKVDTQVSLYQDANSSSKVLETLSYQDLQNYKPIFTNKEGWTKIGSVKTGETGWVKPLAERVKPLQTALTQIRTQQAKIVEQYRTEMFKAERQEAQIIGQLNELNAINQPFVQQPTVIKDAAANNSNYESTSVSYNSANKNGMANVTQSWTGKDGKIHTKTYQVPAKDMNNLVIEG